VRGAHARVDGVCGQPGVANRLDAIDNRILVPYKERSPFELRARAGREKELPRRFDARSCAGAGDGRRI